MRQAALLAVLAALLPGYAYAGLGLGGLAPAPATAEVTANIDVPTDLCDSEFCLAAAPAACGGNCILTPLGNTSVYCNTACIAVWNSASVQSCLLGAATGTYIQRELTTIANRCNAGAIAAARRKAAQTKYNTAFPCTRTVNATILLSLDSCLTGANVTATTACPATCAAALMDIPAACRNTFGTLDADWVPTLDSCLIAPGEAPATSVGAGSPPGSAGSGIFGPSDSLSDTPTDAPTSAASRGASTAMAMGLGAVVAAAALLA
mmetsp:Transcript_12853/g.38788  ORF Transcript_12853/g.38788 Transcript_12853/m.38788 type:complete len:264 (+) Transcript_12853:153-944(+)